MTWTTGVMNIHEPAARATEVARGGGGAGAPQEWAELMRWISLASSAAGVSACLLVRCWDLQHDGKMCRFRGHIYRYRLNVNEVKPFCKMSNVIMYLFPARMAPEIARLHGEAQACLPLRWVA